MSELGRGPFPIALSGGAGSNQTGDHGDVTIYIVQVNGGPARKENKKNWQHRGIKKRTDVEDQIVTLRSRGHPWASGSAEEGYSVRPPSERGRSSASRLVLFQSAAGCVQPGWLSP